MYEESKYSFLIAFRHNFLIFWKIINIFNVHWYGWCFLVWDLRQLLKFPWLNSVHWRSFIRFLFNDINSISQVHLFFHRLNSSSCLISDSKDSKVITWIILCLIIDFIIRTSFDIDTERVGNTVPTHSLIIILLHCRSQVNYIFAFTIRQLLVIQVFDFHCSLLSFFKPVCIRFI